MAGISTKKLERELKRALPPGYKVDWQGHGGHGVVVDPDGVVLRNGRGMPIMVPGSPSSQRRVNNLAREALEAIRSRRP